MEGLTRKTGGQVDDIVYALVDSANDKDKDVQQAMVRALHDIGKRQPMLVLSVSASYLLKHQKLVQAHRVLILDTLTSIIKDASIGGDVELIKELIHLASSELTRSHDIEPEWQTAASNVLVSLGSKASDDVMAELLQNLIPGSLPHYFVILTLANLATENAFGVVPFLKDIFSRMLAMLGMAKQDNLRWVFSHCIGRFSEAILDYCANIENAPYPDITKDRFFGEIFSAYEIMFNVWLQSKESKVRLAVVEALGHMSKLMAREKLEEQVHKMVQGVTALYRKNAEHYLITQSLCMILEAATLDGPTILIPLLEQILIGIHSHACDGPDYSNMQKMKNYNEILRCFQVLTKVFPERVVSFLLHKIETGNEKSKTATLGIFRHIIYSTDTILNNKQAIILSGLMPTLQESSIKIRKAVAQVIIAMAHHNYLDLEGGSAMVEYIIAQCAITENQVVASSKRPTSDHEKNLIVELRMLCENILHLFTTTMDQMEDVLWPFLFETLIPVKYTNGILTICKCLASLAAKKRTKEDPDFYIDFVSQVNVPKPQAIIARLIVLAGYPHKGGGRGLHILKLLIALSPILGTEIVNMWETVLPKLCQYLHENPSNDDKWNQKTWEDLMLKLLSKTLSEIENEDWNVGFGRVLGQQTTLYVGNPEEQSFLFKCLGVVLRKTSTIDFIREHLNLMFSTVDYSNGLEREGCATAVGFCAASYLDQCLLKLEEVTKTHMIRKSTGFMGFIKDKTEADVERIKCVVALCYGYVVFYGPPGLVLSRLETSVLRVLKPYFPTAKDENVKLGLIKAVNLFGKALQQCRSNSDFSFQRRAELLKFMEAYLSKEPKGKISEVGYRAIEAITSLIMLPPALDGQDLEDMIKICADNVYSVPVSPEKSGSPSKSTSKKDNLLESMNEMMKEILKNDCSPTMLQMLIQQLERFLVSPLDHERCRVIKTMLEIFDYYLNNVNISDNSRFSCFGTLLGKLLPRCTDPSSFVRKTSIECVQVLLMVSDRYEYEDIPANVSDDRIKNLSSLKESLEKDDASVLFKVVNELSLVICGRTPDDQLKPLVYSLLDGLVDHHSQSSNGACASLNCIMKHRGAELASEINKLIHDIHNKLQSVQFQATETGTIVAMRTLASHHLILVLTAVLSFQLPFTHVTSEFWQTLAKDKDLTQDTLDHILELLNRTAPFSEKDDIRDKKSPTRTATVLPLTAICALTEILKVPETESLVSLHFSKLFSTIFLYMGSYIGVKPPLTDQKAKRKDSQLQPMSYAMECFKRFLERSKCDNLQKYLEDSNCWNLLEDSNNFTDGLEAVARGLCKTSPKSTNDVVSCLLQALHGTFDSQRIVAASFFAELINQRCNGDMQLVELLMNSLLSKLVDPSHTVRRLCIKGLGNVASAGGQKLQLYSTTILSAMMAGMDDKEDPENSITLESLSGLSRILSKLDESSVRQILINICLRIRPCFEKEKKEVRAAAISLFGNLSRFGTGPSEMSFLEQIHTNFVSILLHLNEEPEVAKACKISLRLIGPRLGSEPINEMFQKHLIEGGNLHYGEFINDLSRLIIEDFHDKINFYVMNCVNFLKSPSKEIRANATTLIGFFLGNLPTEMRENVSKEHVCSALIMLLKDNSSDVRSRTAEALSFLFEY